MSDEVFTVGMIILTLPNIIAAICALMAIVSARAEEDVELLRERNLVLRIFFTVVAIDVVFLTIVYSGFDWITLD